MRTERINVRLDATTNELLRAAAALDGKSLTAFLLDAARAEARRVLAEEDRLAWARRAAAPGPDPASVAPPVPPSRPAHVDV
ncbi:MAG TPA: DUF1778 domain-containing protein [Frankiaceae bacterium]|nr:DUF1778 domain-containing protein [Frankiaceae bacterium]